MDASEIGRYGTVSFMKRLEPDQVVAAFPIDDEQVTFGRDPHCNVRLYYNSISPIHCKIIFQERKVRVIDVLVIFEMVVNHDAGLPRRIRDKWRDDRRVSGLPVGIIAHNDPSLQQFRNRDTQQALSLYISA